MKTAYLIPICSAFLFFIFTGPVLGTEENQAAQPVDANPVQAVGLFRVGDLIGKTVHSPQNERIGKIHDLIVGGRGHVRFIILTSNETDRLIPVPWEAANLQMQQDRLVANLNLEKIENAPTFQIGQWDKFVQSEYELRIHSYFGTQQELLPPQDFRIKP